MFRLEASYSPLFERLAATDKPMVLLRGGSSSTKTYSMSQLMAEWLMTGTCGDHGDYDIEGVFSVVRKYNATLKKSVMRDFETVLKKMEVWTISPDEGDDNHYPTGEFVEEKMGSAWDFIEYEKSQQSMRYGGRVVEFFGADDEQKVRGARRDYLYCNEANELKFKSEYHQLNLRTRKRVFMDFNPDDEESWLNKEIEQKRCGKDGDCALIVSTYHDNPFLEDRVINEIERLEEIDPNLWKIYGLGEYGRKMGVVFPKWVQLDEEDLKDAELLGYGLDFGYTNDPTSLIAVYRLNNEFIYHELIYETGLTNQDIADRMHYLKVDRNLPIIADSAEPKSIEEISREGWFILPTLKGADSISNGINLVKQGKISVTSSSINLKAELKKYIWLVDKYGEQTNRPIDRFNHAIDALRYFVMWNYHEQKEGNIAFL